MTRMIRKIGNCQNVDGVAERSHVEVDRTAVLVSVQQTHQIR